MILFLCVLYSVLEMLRGLSLLRMGTMMGCMFILLKVSAILIMPSMICCGCSVPMSFAPIRMSIMSSFMLCDCMCWIEWCTVFSFSMAAMFLGEDEMI